MAGTATRRHAPDREILVAYDAFDAVADRDRLCAWLHDVIHGHLLSITEVDVDAWNLRARIEQCRMEPHAGIVRLTLNGTVAGRPIEESIVVQDEPPPAGFTMKEHTDQATKLAFANAFTFLGRLLFPSELVRALGRRRISGRLVRAWLDCCREIRIAIDEVIARPNSGGQRAWRSTVRTAILSGLLFAALSAAGKLLFRPHQRDDFAAWVGCGLIGVGMFGAVGASGLLLLPSRFYQAERAGAALARRFGVKSLAGIRVVAFGLLLVALLAALFPGIHLVRSS